MSSNFLQKLKNEEERQDLLKANRKKELETKMASILKDNNKTRTALAPATGQLMNTTGIIEVGDNVRNLNYAIKNAKFQNLSEKRSKLLTTNLNEQGNVKYPVNASFREKYGFTPEEYYQKQISRSLGRTPKGRLNFAYFHAHVTAQLDIVDSMRKMLKMNKKSDEFAEMSENLKRNIYRLIQALGEKYNAKSRADKVLEDLLNGLKDKKEKENLTDLYKSIIPQDQTTINNEIKSFTTVIEEQNPMFASNGGRRRRNQTRKSNRRRRSTRKH